MSGPDPVWPADNQPSTRYPGYTRGNVGEVFPSVVSPLTWTLYGGEAEHGWRDAFTRFGAFSTADYGPERMVVLGVFGGYCYLNLSLIRIFAVRTPGLSVEAMDRQFFGEADAPPYRPAAGDRDRRAGLRVGRTLLATLRAKALPELDGDKAELAAWMASLPPPGSASDRDLVGVLYDFQPRFRRLFDRHIHTSFQATVGPGLVQDLCAGKLGDPGLVVTLLGGIGEVESAAPSAGMWDLGRMVAADPALTALFDAGLDGLEQRLEADPAAQGFRARLAAFTDEFGSRGPNEWEGSSSTWETRPALVLAAVDRMRLAADSHDPRRRHAELESRRRAATEASRAQLGLAARKQFDLALRSAIVFSQGRERSKTTVIRGLHAVRLRQLELARRARQRGGPPDLHDFWLVRADELDGYLAAPAAWRDELAERAALRDRLTALEPPFVFEGRQPALATWSPRGDGEDAVPAGTELHGIAGAPGVARGRARVVLDPIDPRGLAPGEILVAPITDPSWTPLFVAADGVVVDVGAQMSHAVIVARELGIPAVVSVTGATHRIPDGALIEVDGGRGIVRLIG